VKHVLNCSLLSNYICKVAKVLYSSTSFIAEREGYMNKWISKIGL